MPSTIPRSLRLDHPLVDGRGRRHVDWIFDAGFRTVSASRSVKQQADPSKEIVKLETSGVIGSALRPEGGRRRASPGR